MKATGIVRRIDDLGRVVIPKEIRRTLRIREGDPLEIFTDQEGEVILKKYSMMSDLGSFAQQYVDSIAQTTGHIAAVADRETVIAIAGAMKKEFLEKSISKELQNLIDERKTVLASGESKDYHEVVDEKEHYAFQAISPIICEGDAVGAVVILSKKQTDNFGEAEKKIAASAAGFLGRQMEQ